MFRSHFSMAQSHECVQCETTLVCLTAPSFAARIDDLIDDFLDMRVGIIKVEKRRLSDADIDQWLLNEADSPFGAQFTNGTSTLFLLKRHNGIECVTRIADQYNQLHQKKKDQKWVYASTDIVTAFRDARIFFPKVINEPKLLIEATRAYASSHLVEALASHLAEAQLGDKLEKETKLQQQFIFETDFED